MKKVLETKLNSQMNSRAEALALEKAFDLKTGLRDSMNYFYQHYSELTFEEKLKISENEYKIIHKIRDMFNLEEVFEKGRYVLYAEIKKEDI